MGQPQSVQIQSEINHNDANVAKSNNGSKMEETNLNGQKTESIETNTNKEFTLKTISSISSSGHDFVDDEDETATFVSDEEDDFDSDDEEDDEELEGELYCSRDRSFVGSFFFLTALTLVFASIL